MNGNTKMDILKKILKVAYNFLFAILMIIAAFIILTSYNVIKGYEFYVVMSGSMEPKIHTGSIVSVKTANQYNKGDIITIKMKNDPSQTYTHRIVDINETSDGITYTTKGDANEDTDPDVASQTNVIGKVVFSMPLIGYATHFSKQPAGFILMIVAPTIIIISSELNTIKDFVKERLAKRKKVNSKKKRNDKT